MVRLGMACCSNGLAQAFCGIVILLNVGFTVMATNKTIDDLSQDLAAISRDSI